MISREYAAFLEKIKSMPVPSSLEEARESFEKMMEDYPSPFDVQFEITEIYNIRCEWAIPKKSSGKMVILFFHGGGFSMGSAKSHQALAGLIAEGTSARVLSIDYRLAPEHPFPAALEDCLTAYRFLLNETGYAPSQIILAGNSSGGGLVMSTLLSLKNNNEPLPFAAICISPWADLTLSGKSLIKAEQKFLELKKLQEQYVGSEDPKNPLISPIFGDLKGLPPLLIHTGDKDDLLDDAKRLGVAAKQAGVDTTLEIWKEMVHTLHVFAPKIPEAKEGVDGVVAWILGELAKNQ